MSYALKIIKDNPAMFLQLDETSGTVAYDSSGCGNDATYVGSLTTNIFPLIPGGSSGSVITDTNYITCSINKDYYGQTQTTPFAVDGFSDNDFSIEIWLYPNFNSSENIVFADNTNSVGLFWDNGNIVFKLNTETLEYSLKYIKKATHVVASYLVGGMAIYIDGQMMVYQAIPGFKFTNTSLNMSVGPADLGSSFIVDAVAIYRYALSPLQIESHYVSGQQQINPIHIVFPDEGILYPLTDENTKQIMSYSYPLNKSFDKLVVSGLTHDYVTNSLYLTPTTTASPVTVIVTDTVAVPLIDEIVRSKISWEGDNGISVRTSLDGLTYEQCSNGEEIPQYSNGVMSGSGEIYLEITFDSSDASRFNPELSSLNISMYDTNNLYAINYGEYVESIGSTNSYTVGSKNYPILSRDYRNGLRLVEDGGFKIVIDKNIETIEFLYSKTSDLYGALISGTSFLNNDIYYKWTSPSNYLSSGIQAIYINGSLMTGDLSDYSNNELYHVVIVLSEPISNEINFNSFTGTDGKPSTYKNIALYEYSFNQAKALNHYDLYASRPSATASDSTMTVTESAPDVYNNDWVVIQSI